ncbi:MAG: S28 family serine protease [Mucinivorans sp.]
MMNYLRIAFAVIFMTAMVGCSEKGPEQPIPPTPPPPTPPPIENVEAWLKTLPGVQSVEELKTEKYASHFLVIFKQLIDPKNPAVGTFDQRVFVSHQNFADPVVFETQGYHAQNSMTRTFKTELINRYKANRIEVEHRYAGLSLPSPLDWKYLTYENAAADLHAVRVALGKGYTGSWLATGVSKGGTNTMSYMMYYPQDVTAGVAYVGPICNAVEDTRIVDHIMNVGTPEMRKKIVDFQRELLIRRDTIQPLFYRSKPKPTKAKEYMTNDQKYELAVLSFVYKVLQYGYDVDEIPTPDMSTDEITDYAGEKKIFGRRKPKSDLKSSVEYFTDELGDYQIYLGDYQIYLDDYQIYLDDYQTRTAQLPILVNTHYYVQVLIEMGGLANVVQPLEDLMPNHKSWSEHTMARFIVPADAADIKYSDVWNRNMNKWLQEEDPRLICVYGQYDPWTAAAPDKNYFVGKSNMAIYIKKEGAHSSKIKDLSQQDRQAAWAKLDSWIKK